MCAANFLNRSFDVVLRRLHLDSPQSIACDVADIQQTRLKLWRSRIIQKLSDALIDPRDFGFQLARQALELVLLLRIGRRESRAQMIQSEIDIVQWIPNLMRDCRCETTDDDRFLRVV